MPLMLDSSSMNGPMQVDQLDVDDLFGEGVGLSLSNARTPSKQLYQRVDDLRTRGCCQAIAWSKSGVIASISPDGKSVQARVPRADPADGSWALSEPTTIDLITATSSNPIVHLAWAPTAAHELAVIDATGRVAIVAFTGALNRPYPTRKWDDDHVDDLHAVVGCFWLNLASQHKNYHVVHGPAVKDATGYRYESSFVHAFGPWHPNPTRSALLCVTANGLLRLYWMQSGSNRFEETTMELESLSSSDDLITHASLHSDRNQIFIALATASRQLRLLRVTISWGIPQSDGKVPPGAQPLNPTMHAKHLAVSTWMPGLSGVTPCDPFMTQLSHIELLPSQMDSPGQPWAPINVLVVRTYLPALNAPYQETQTIIDRWELTHEPPPALHPAFEQMSSRTNHDTTPADKDPNCLQKLDPIIINNKILIGMHTINFGKRLCLAFSDGSIEYRDRFTLQETYNETNLDRVMTLHQAGLTFAEESPCLQAALSPTNCSVAQMLEDGRVKWNRLHYPMDNIGDSNQDATYAAVIAALTVAASAATFYHVNCDDILAVARPYAEKKNFTRDWVNEIVRMLKVPVDYSEETQNDNPVRNHSLQLCLSIINHMGFRGEFKPRSFSGKFALLSLNIRNTIILITFAINTPSNMREKLSPLDEHEVVDALSGCVKWSLDVISYLVDSLYSLLQEPQFMDLLQPSRFNEVSSYIQSQSNPALQLLLCSSSRGFLSSVCRRVLHMEALSNKAIEFYDRRAAIQNANDPSSHSKLPHELHRAYQKLHQITSSSLVKVQEVERLLNTFTSDVRVSYQSAFASLAAQHHKKEGGNAPEQKHMEAQIKSAQFHAELNILLSGQPPPPFLPVLRKFFTQDLPALKTQTDPAKLFFADFSLLEIQDSKRTLEARRAARRYVDVFRRVEITPPASLTTPPSPTPAPSQQGLNHQEGKGDEASKDATPQWRRCVRCAAVMEDVAGVRAGFMFVMSQQRRCSCGGYWVVLPKGAMAG
ncbi:mediator of RNA polymerase II transcription subunit 16 [Sodiomyces alkalinus F11]|uniref:Mediator of RNA polymerase II transcription subunit 16 n=1 Tax=Sodiomyces alkalinus (strain CBS 110278 / VKM F-3762 / F11) TaxID=1314773 RepID=A0A3N2PRH0_SODAK|nr:mediator of RNA polymerase II transcription subunit 16 [Sodiomyces alkalinus F11]ROT36946.1 mediator of RNA polymerase II transcription subunit 16 [Sodiomyces alkalinus F11]